MKYLFAVNPVSGKNKAKKRMLQLASLLREHHYDFITYETQPYHYADDLRSLIKEQGVTHVFAVGGDGTAHEVLNAVVGLDVILGVIPFGSGNDFARVMNLPKKIEAVFEMIDRNRVELIDIGQFSDRYFLNYLSFGMDVSIVKAANKFKWIGKGAYILALFETLLTYKPVRMHINEYEEITYLTTIHNGRYYGGGLKINPLAEVNDGLLNFVAVKKLARLRFLFLFPSVFTGKHLKIAKYVYHEAKPTFTIDIKGRIVAGVDGECYYFDQPLEVHIANKQIRIIT